MLRALCSEDSTYWGFVVIRKWQVERRFALHPLIYGINGLCFGMECNTTIDASVGCVARQRRGCSHVWRDVNYAAAMLRLRPLTYGTDDLYFGMECDNQQRNCVESWSVNGGKKCWCQRICWVSNPSIGPVLCSENARSAKSCDSAHWPDSAHAVARDRARVRAGARGDSAHWPERSRMTHSCTI